MHETNARPGGIRIVRLGRCAMCTRLNTPRIYKALDIRRNMPPSQAAMKCSRLLPITSRHGHIEQVRGGLRRKIQGLVAKNLVEEKGASICRAAR